MQLEYKKLLYIALLIICIFSLGGCDKTRREKAKFRSWEKIKESGVLRVLTMNNSTSYFLYRREEMGCEYELAKQFAEAYGLKLKIITAPKFEDLTKMLLYGKGDLIAFDMPVAIRYKSQFRYCGPGIITHQVLVQRKDETKITNLSGLIGKNVYVEKSSKYEVRVHNLSKELGGGINILNQLGDTVSTDGFIDGVATGNIDYTIADNVIATLNKGYYNNIDISVNVGFAQQCSWMTVKENEDLADSLNSWVDKNNRSKKYLSTMRKYFKMSKWGNEKITPSSIVISLKRGIISSYDNLFKKCAKNIKWDWRLLAAMAYYESKFDATLVSWAGAEGLMQIMPKTADAFKEEDWDMKNIEQNILTATRNIASLNRSFSKIENEDERLKFIIAAYNSGLGHILDAIALAKKYGKDPKIWDKNVEEALFMKREPEYFNDPVCRCGYFNASETSNYVNNVMGLFKYYKHNLNIK